MFEKQAQPRGGIGYAARNDEEILTQKVQMLILKTLLWVHQPRTVTEKNNKHSGL